MTTYENGLCRVGTSPTLHLIDDRAPAAVIQPACHAGQAKNVQPAPEDELHSTCGRCALVAAR